MPGPGSVHMADADDIIEILSSEEGGGSDGAAGSMSEGGSEDYNYSTDEDASGDLGEEDPRPVSVSEKKLPYRIIDSEALKQVQVRPVSGPGDTLWTPVPAQQTPVPALRRSNSPSPCLTAADAGLDGRQRMAATLRPVCTSAPAG